MNIMSIEKRIGMLENYEESINPEKLITKEVIRDAREKLTNAINRLATRIRETEGTSRSN